MALRNLLRRKIVKRGLITLGLLIVPIIGFFAAFIFLFLPIIPSPKFHQPANQNEANLQDLEYLKTFPKYDKSFSEGDRESDFIRFVEDLEARVEDFSAGDFELAVAQAVALANNAHTNVSPEERSSRVNQFPVRFARFREGILIVQARREHGDLLGARVESFAGVPTAEIIERFRPYFGGREQRARFYAPLNMGSPQLIHALGIGESPESMELAFVTRDGQFMKRVLRALSPDQSRYHPYGRDIYEYVLPEAKGDGWQVLMEGQIPPRYLKHPSRPFDHQFLDQYDGIYIRLDFNHNRGRWNLKKFLRSVKKELEVRTPSFAVIDLRFNNGGTSTLEEFAETLPTLLKPDGDIYVVTSGGTFSYGIGAAAMFRYYGNGKVLIVGEPVGDRLRFWANGGTTFRLPNSGITMRAWSSLEDYENGCWDWMNCFWFSPTFRRRGIESLRVDVPIEQSFDDYVAGRDSVLTTILGLRTPSDRS